ncbi:MAG: aldehyde dehydrogenase family protein [Chloroflexi bacterium]|nr:aldehyde dehydrogenase family protein [Chloroflexota bacterium]
MACSIGAYTQMAGKPGNGPVTVDEQRHLTQLASPVGVVFALGPVTNPVSTFIFKSLICVKSRNALIYSPNRRAQKVASRVEDLIKGALREHGAPLDLVQCVRARTSRKQTQDFMRHPNVSFILATGGPSMVKAAYSSGTPAIGVGPANTPVLVCSDADLPDVARSIVMSKTFDNGLLCGAEHNLVVMEDVRRAFVEECERQDAAVLTPDEAARFTERLVRKDGRFKGTIVGQTAEKLARQGGVERDYPIKLLIVPSAGITADNAYAREKLAPILSLFTVATEEEGLRACHDLLMIDGPGHTAVIFTQDPTLIDRFGRAMPAGRILVNSPAVHGMLGITTGLAISTTLGCGTFGGTSTTDNVTYTHVQNTKRVAHFLPEAAAIWRKLGFL